MRLLLHPQMLNLYTLLKAIGTGQADLEFRFYKSFPLTSECILNSQEVDDMCHSKKKNIIIQDFTSRTHAYIRLHSSFLNYWIFLGGYPCDLICRRIWHLSKLSGSSLCCFKNRLVKVPITSPFMTKSLARVVP